MIARQYWALFLLKWTLLRRGWARRKAWGLVLIGLLLFMGALFSLLGAAVLYGLGAYVSQLEGQTPLLLLLNGVVGIYLFFYAWGMLMDLQRADIIDFRKMLLLPVSLPAIYLINFVVSLAGPLSLFAVPGIAGLLLGLRYGYDGGLLGVGAVLALLLMLVVNSWGYYLRGRLAILMENKRRRRIIFILLPLCFVALGQLPAVVSHLATLGGERVLSAHALTQATPALLLLNAIIPVFWAAYGLWAYLAGPGLWHTGLSVLGLVLCAALGLRLGYVTTVRHYMGLYDSGVRAPRPGALPQQQPSSRPTPLTARRLPLLSEETSALTLAFYRSFARHPQVRLLLIMPLCMGMFFLIMYRTGAYGRAIPQETHWLPMAVLIWPFFNFSFFIFNQFGVDAASFQQLLLFPTPRYKYLLAKNLALAPYALGLALFFVAVGVLLTAAPLRVMLLSLALVAHLYLLFSLVGNYLSLWLPYRFSRDALRQPTGRMRMLLIGLGSSMLSVILILPASACMLFDRLYPAQDSAGGAYTGLLGATALLLLTMLAYWPGLFRAGDLFTARGQLVYARLHMDRE